MYVSKEAKNYDIEFKGEGSVKKQSVVLINDQVVFPKQFTWRAEDL